MTRAIALLHLSILISPASLLAQTKSDDRTIHVQGEGTATAEPDTAVVQMGVVTQDEHAADALAAQSDAIGRVIATLKKFEIADRDMQTSGLRVQPQYSRTNDRSSLRRPVGYQATNQLRVTVRKLSRLGQVLDAVVGAGTNQLSGVQFDIDDPSELLNLARRRAITDARQRAELYAQAAGAEVGRVLTISEQGFPTPRPMPMARMMAAEASSAVPIAKGELEVQARVQMVFELKE